MSSSPVGQGITVLVVDDEPVSRLVLRQTLTQQGYAVKEARDGLEAVERVAEGGVDVITLDLCMPELDGMAVIQRLRHHGHNQPIIVVSNLNDTDGMVRALELGADDFIAKPASPRLVSAHIQAQLRRTPAQLPPASRVLHFGPTIINLETKHATQAGRPLLLTRIEYAILTVLHAAGGQPVSRDRLLGEVWGYEAGTRTRTVETHIWRLRKKIDDAADSPRWLRTHSGLGYLLVADEKGLAR